MESQYDLLALECLGAVTNDDGSVIDVDSFTNGYFAAAGIYALLAVAESIKLLTDKLPEQQKAGTQLC